MAGSTTHRCEARSKRTSEQCKRLTTWQSKAGKWLCKMHGRNDSDPGGPPAGNHNAVTTGENAKAVLSRAEQFAQDCQAAPVDPTTILQEQARRTYGRLQFMLQLLLQTEQQMMQLAADGDETAVTALAIVEISRKQEPRTVGEGDQRTTQWAETELSTKSRSLLDRWHAQQDAITRVELLQGRIADRLKPPPGLVNNAGGIGTLIINNSMPGVDDDGGGETR